MIKNSKLSQYLIVSAGALSVFITLGLNHSNGLYLIPISEKLNTGRELFSLAGAFGILFTGIAAPVFGGLADKYGPGKTLLILALLQSLSWAWLSTIESTFDLFGARVLMGIGGSAILGIALSATGKSVSSENRSLFLGFIMASGSFGQFILVPVLNFVIQIYSWQTASVVSALFATSLFLFAYLIGTNSSDNQNSLLQKQTLSDALKEAFRNKSYNLLTIGFFVCGFHVTFVATHLPAFLSDNKLELWVGGVALSLIGLFNIVGTLSYGYLGSKYSKKNLLSSLYSMRSLLFLLFILSPKNEMTVLIFASILGVLWLSTVPLTNGIISDIFGQRYVSTLFGITLLSHHIGSFLGSWLGGRIFDIYGSYDPVWWICVILGFVSAAIHFPIIIKPVKRLENVQV